MIILKTYTKPKINQKEILRYLGCSKADPSILSLLAESLKEAEESFTYKVCYCEFQVKIDGDFCDFSDFSVRSKDLATNLKGCNKTILFAATVGIRIDRLIEKYIKIAPSKAVLLQAIGAERIESLCDLFCQDIKEEYDAKLKPRFSAGYGDLPLATQKEIFKILDCQRKIGLTLNRSLMMSPTKSVTAFAGICQE